MEKIFDKNGRRYTGTRSDRSSYYCLYLVFVSQMQRITLFNLYVSRLK